MVLSADGVRNVALTCMSAMAKIFIVGCVGVACAKYPASSPLLPKAALQYFSRISNLIFLPALIVSSLGSGLSVPLLARYSKLILFSLLMELISYICAFSFGKLLIEKNNELLYVAVAVAIGSPNAISLPLMVTETICEQAIVSNEYGSSDNCVKEANSMLFVYSIGWHLVFWSYGYPTLSSLRNKHEGIAVDADANTVTATSPSNKSWSQKWTERKAWFLKVVLSPSMVAIYIGCFVGLIEPLQRALWKDFTVLRPFGSGKPHTHAQIHRQTRIHYSCTSTYKHSHTHAHLRAHTHSS